MKRISILALLALSTYGQVDYFDLSLEQLLDVKVSISTLDEVDETNAIGTVHKIEKSFWKLNGSTKGFDPLKGVQGIEVHQNLGGTQGVSIRGYSGQTTSVRGVATLFDGIPLNEFSFGTAIYTKSFLPLNILSSVEVAKGPISSLYGPDAFHGAISLMPQNYEEDEVNVEVGVGSFQNYNTSILNSKNIGKAKLVTNISLIGQKDASINDADKDFDRKESYQSFALYQSVEFERSKIGLLVNRGKASEMLNISFDESGTSGTNHFHNNLLYLKDERKLSSTRSIQTTSWYQDSHMDLNFDITTKRYSRWNDKKAGVKLLLLDEDKSTKLSIDYGFEYIKDWVSDASSQVDGANSIPSGYNRYSRATTSALTNIKYNQSKRVVGFLGARVDHFSNTNELSISPRLGLNYKTSENNTFKTVASKGIRIPVGGEIAGTTTINGNKNLDSENMTSYEVGQVLKYKSFKISSALFMTKWVDAIQSSGSPSTFQNTGKNSSYGLEWDIRNIFKDHSMIFLNGHYIRSKNDESHLEYTAFPRLSLNWGYKYKRENVELLLENNHKFNVTRTPNKGAKELPSFFNTNLGLRYYQSKDLSYLLNINNLFNIKNKYTSLWGVSRGGESERIKVNASLNMKF